MTVAPVHYIITRLGAGISTRELLCEFHALEYVSNLTYIA